MLVDDLICQSINQSKARGGAGICLKFSLVIPCDSFRSLLGIHNLCFLISFEIPFRKASLYSVTNVFYLYKLRSPVVSLLRNTRLRFVTYSKMLLDLTLYYLLRFRSWKKIRMEMDQL